MKIVAILLFAFTCFYLGGYGKQQDIENRAKTMDLQECYSNQDIEYIIFGTIQE